MSQRQTQTDTINGTPAQGDESAIWDHRVLRALLDSVPQGVYWKDRQSRYLGCNQIVARSFGFSSINDVIGLTDFDLPGLTREQAMNFVARDLEVMERNRPLLGIIEQATHADGSTVWLETNKVPILDADGTVIGVLGTSQDITARKISEEQLRQSELRYRSLVKATSAVTWHAPVNRLGTEPHPEWMEFTGQSEEEMINGGWRKVVHADDVDRVSNLWIQAIASEQPFLSEHRIRRHDGQWRWMRSHAVPLRDEQGKVAEWMGMNLDITELLNAEEALRVSEARLMEAQRIARLGSWEINLETNQANWSDEGFRLLGYAPNEVAPSQEAFFERVHPEDRDYVRGQIERAIRESEPLQNEFRVLNADGSIRWLFSTGKMINDPPRFLGITLDITERKQAEEERRRLESQLQHLQKLESLGVLAGGIAHDFNNILTSILGYADLALLELPNHSAARPHISEVVNGARNAADLTKQMLAYSGKGRFVIQLLNLNDIVEDMTSLLQVSISKKCVLKYHLMADLPSIEADAVQMRQILMNLIINASDAIGDRSGVIAITTGVMYCDRAYLSETYLDDQLVEDNYVYMEVADTGCGMSEVTRARIFDPFFSTKTTGRGLGLAAVLGIVRGHKGALKVYSELDRGTTFKVLIPAINLPARPKSGDPKADLAWQGSGTVLVVDDEDSARAIERHMLMMMGFDVITASDGREGVDVFRQNVGRIRMVFLDMTMPHLDGAETFREMRRIKSDVVAILTSGYNEQSATNRFAGKGLAGFIQKPFRYEELLKVVRSVIEK